MVDSPEKLSRICLERFVTLIRTDQWLWKEYLEKFFRQQQQSHCSELLPEQKRRQSCSSRNRSLFIDLFLQGHCPLNVVLSERLSIYLIEHDFLNDFTLSLFSRHVTCLRRLRLDVKYLTRLSLSIVNEHPTLVELEIIFRHPPITTINEQFSRRICPPRSANIEGILTIYSPFFSRTKSSRSASISSSSSSITTIQAGLEEFSHQKLFHFLLTNFHPMTIERLTTLSVSHYKFFPGTTRKPSMIDMSPLIKCSTSTLYSIPTNLLLLLKLTNLTMLNISSTDMKNPCFDLLIDSLGHLESLDISSCRSIKSFHSLFKTSSRLKSLNLSNCSFESQLNPSIYEICLQLTRLEYLDLSEENSTSQIIDEQNDLNRFLSSDQCLPRLKHLDLSGHMNISSICLEKFLHQHRQLQFLGLFLTQEKISPIRLNITTCRYTYDIQHLSNGTLTEQDLIVYEPFLIECLRRYRERIHFLQKTLFYIFALTRAFHSKQQILLLELILQAMSMHSDLQSIQMASTACMYNITRAPLNEQISLKSLKHIVQATIKVMETFPNHQQLQKNCLLTLCSDRILHQPKFEFVRLGTLVMMNLQNSSDLTIIQPGVAILSLITTRLTIDECTQLGSIVNIKRLLQIIERQIDRLQTTQYPHIVHPLHHDQSGQSLHEIDTEYHDVNPLTSDDTLRFSLSLLWNLTDENPIVCEIFIDAMGLQLFQRLLHLFASDTIVLTKIVGLLSNISEVSHLKISLYSIDIIPLMQRYLNESIVDVAFSACAILAHLLYEQTDDEIDWDLCEQMRQAILSWQNPHTNMVTYRSFKSFFPLLFCTRIPVVQLWAMWAIYHVCSTDRLRYNQIIREEKIYDVMWTLYENQQSLDHSDSSLIEYLTSIIELLRSQL